MELINLTLMTLETPEQLFARELARALTAYNNILLFLLVIMVFMIAMMIFYYNINEERVLDENIRNTIKSIPFIILIIMCFITGIISYLLWFFP